MGLLESKYDNDDSQADRVGDVMMAWLRANDPRPDMMKIHELAVERLQECYAETIAWVDRAGDEPCRRRGMSCPTCTRGPEMKIMRPCKIGQAGLFWCEQCGTFRVSESDRGSHEDYVPKLVEQVREALGIAKAINLEASHELPDVQR